MKWIEMMTLLIFRIACLVRWLMIGIFPVIAMESEHTLPVHGKGDLCNLCFLSQAFDWGNY